jgi:SpoVK/Ycf46/Vps4 family AAA+-type ATPase/intein/homing endonuclease
MMEEISLKVGELTNRDEFGRGIVRIDAKIIQKLGLREGDIIELQGQRKTGAMAIRSYPSDVGLNIIRMDGITRRNAGIGVGENIKIVKASVKDARKVTLAPAQKGIILQMSPDLLKKNLILRPVMKKDIVAPFPVAARRRGDPFDDFFGGMNIEEIFFAPIPGETKLAVVSTNPEGIVRVTEETEVELRPEAVEIEEKVIPTLTYEDIGGLGEAIIKIREMVELPMRHPELFTKLGIEPPKGVLLYGPPGTGKTLIAKAVANESNANFFPIGGPEIMCVGPNTPVLLNNKIMKAEEVFKLAEKKGKLLEEKEKRKTIGAEGLGVYSLGDGMKLEKDEITEVTRLEADSFSVKTYEGTEITVSKNQPFAVLENGKIVWKRTEDLKAGDYVASVKELNLDGKIDLEWADKLNPDYTIVRLKTGKEMILKDFLKSGKKTKEVAGLKFSSTRSNASMANLVKIPEINPEAMRFIGAMFAEGSIPKRMDAVYFANTNETFKKEMASIVSRSFGVNGNSTEFREEMVAFYSRSLAEFLSKVMQLPVGKKEEMHMPDYVYPMDKNSFSSFVSGYFDGDGTISYGTGGFPTPRFYSKSREFLNELQALLQAKLSIPSKVDIWRTPLGNLWALTVMGNDGRKTFMEEILSKSMKKKEWKLSGKEMGEDVIPNISSLIKDIKGKLGIKYGKDIKESSIEPYISGRKIVTTRKLREMLSLFRKKGEIEEMKSLDAILQSDVRFVRIKSIENAGRSVLYDFGVKKNSNFLGGLPFLLLHNSKWYGQSEENLRKIFEDAEKSAPSIIFIDEIDAIAPKREEVTGEVERRVVSQILTLMDGLKSRGKVIVIAATNRPNALDPALRRPGRFDREIEIGVPDQKGRKEILQIHTRNMPMDRENVKLDKLAEVTYGFVGADLEALAKEAAMSALRRNLPAISWRTMEDIPPKVIEKLRVMKQDFDSALRLVEPSAMREVLVEVPKVKWDDVGGLKEVKESLQEIVEWPLKHPESFERIGIRPPKGILLYGPPGSGKTLLARAVATESGANFISIKGPEITSKWVGESEKNIRDIFKRARQVAPAIIFFDEIDALAPLRGLEAGTRVSENIVSMILTEMSGLEDMHNVVVIAATNRPDILDPALLRPGRFDRQVLVPAPDQEARLEILKVHARKMPFVEKEKFAKKKDEMTEKEEKEYKKENEKAMLKIVTPLAKETDGYSGADLEALVREAGLNALRKDFKAKTVGKADFTEALRKVRPSVTPELVKFYSKISERMRAPPSEKSGKEKMDYVG